MAMVLSFINYDSETERLGVETLTNRLSVKTVWGKQDGTTDTTEFGTEQYIFLVLT